MNKVAVMPANNEEADARKAFTEHVQSVAFQISLSRRMIELLRETRDYGFPHGANWEENKAHRDIVAIRHHRGPIRKEFTSHDLVGPIKSLERRGLIIFNRTPYESRKKGELWLRLSLAGEIMCELLVTAGLMPEQAEAKKAGSR